MMGGHVDGMGWWLLLLAAVGTVAFWVAVALVIRVLLPAREREDSSPDRPMRCRCPRHPWRGEVSVGANWGRCCLVIDSHWTDHERRHALPALTPQHPPRRPRHRRDRHLVGMHEFAGQGRHADANLRSAGADVAVPGPALG